VDSEHDVDNFAMAWGTVTSMAAADVVLDQPTNRQFVSDFCTFAIVRVYCVDVILSLGCQVSTARRTLK
jgi:hypothetical protein